MSAWAARAEAQTASARKDAATGQGCKRQLTPIFRPSGTCRLWKQMHLGRRPPSIKVQRDSTERHSQARVAAEDERQLRTHSAHRHALVKPAVHERAKAGLGRSRVPSGLRRRGHLRKGIGRHEFCSATAMQRRPGSFSHSATQPLGHRVHRDDFCDFARLVRLLPLLAEGTVDAFKRHKADKLAMQSASCERIRRRKQNM